MTDTDPPSAAPRARSALLPIFLIVLVDVLGLTIVFPLLGIYAEHFGASAFVASLLVPTYAVCQLVAGPILGGWSDRVGRKPILLLSQAGTLLGFLLIASAGSLWVVFVGRILDGLTAGNLSVAQAYIADNTTVKNRARSFALIGIAFGVGFTLGPAITSYASRWGMNTPFYIAALLSLTSIVCTATLLPAERRGESAEAAPDSALPGGKRLGVLQLGAYVDYFKRPTLNGLLAEFFLYLSAFSLFISGFALFAERRYSFHGHAFGPREIGMLFTLSGLVGIVIQGGLIGRLVARFGESKLILVGLLLLGSGYALLPHVEPIGPLVGATILASVGNALLRPNLTSLITRAARKGEQGTVLGLTQSLASLANITAAPLSGWLIDHSDLTAWGTVAAALCGAALFMRQFGSSRMPHVRDELSTATGGR